MGEDKSRYGAETPHALMIWSHMSPESVDEVRVRETLVNNAKRQPCASHAPTMRQPNMGAQEMLETLG
jgi:hypothetical protein